MKKKRRGPRTEFQKVSTLKVAEKMKNHQKRSRIRDLSSRKKTKRE